MQIVISGSNIIVQNCVNNGEIKKLGESSGGAIGGIVGGAYNSNGNSKVTIISCKNYGEVNNESESTSIGGIAGRVVNGNIVTNCQNYGDINGYSFVGGILGLNSGTIESCKNYGKIVTRYSRGGGIVGHNGNDDGDAIISRCSNYGYIYMPESGYFGTGGIAGSNGNITNKSTIELCYNEGEVYNLAVDKQAGGIVGNLSPGSPYPPGLAEVINCYNKGYIHGVSVIGGIAGYMQNSNIKNCYNVRKNF